MRTVYAYIPSQSQSVPLFCVDTGTATYASLLSAWLSSKCHGFTSFWINLSITKLSKRCGTKWAAFRAWENFIGHDLCQPLPNQLIMFHTNPTLGGRKLWLAQVQRFLWALPGDAERERKLNNSGAKAGPWDMQRFINIYCIRVPNKLLSQGPAFLAELLTLPEPTQELTHTLTHTHTNKIDIL